MRDIRPRETSLRHGAGLGEQKVLGDGETMPEDKQKKEFRSCGMERPCASRRQLNRINQRGRGNVVSNEGDQIKRTEDPGGKRKKVVVGRGKKKGGALEEKEKYFLLGGR